MIIAVDLGTTGVRVAAIADDFTVLTLVKRRIELLSPTPHGRLCRLADVEDAVIGGIREIVARNTLPIDAISFASQGEVVFALEGGEAPPYFAVTMDNTGLAASREWIAARGAESFHKITGQPCHPMYPVFRFRAGRNACASSTGRIVTLDGYLRLRLGGSHSADLSLVARSGLFDVEQRDWSAELTEWAGLSAADLPEALPAASLAGKVDAEGERLTGLPQGTPIVVGSHDQASVFWGVGGEPGVRPAFSAGSSECLTQASHTRPHVPGLFLPSYPVNDTTWLTLMGTPSGGWALEWLATFAGYEDVSSLVNQACALASTEVLVYPYLAGGPALRNDPTATGEILGLNLGSRPPDVARAMLEASGFELFDAITRTASAFGHPSVIATAGTGAVGGASQIRANAAEVPLDLVGADATLRGTAIQAAVAIGKIPSLIPSPAPPEAERFTPLPNASLRAKRERYLSRT